MEIFRDYKDDSSELHKNKHTVIGPADQQDLIRSYWLTDVLEELKKRWPSSFDNVGRLETAISVCYLRTQIFMVFNFFRL